MRIAQVEDGVVVNVIEVSPNHWPDFAKGWPQAGEAGPGWVVDGKVFKPPAPRPAAELRASIAPISPLQGILTLGEKEWAKVLAYRDHADTTWGERVIIDNAADWVRTSQNIAFFGHLLGYTDDQMDALFRAAAQVRA